ncbi:hypothetical protein ACFL4O_00980 [bacterium]
MDKILKKIRTMTWPYIGMSLLVLFLFALKDILILLFTQNGHLYAVVNTCVTTFEETYLYFPILKIFNVEHIFLFLSQTLSFIPIGPFLIGKILYKSLFMSSNDLFLFFSHLIPPFLSFWLIFLIFRKYISRSWSFLLAFLGIMFYNNFSFAAYFYNIIFHHADFIRSSSLNPLEIQRFPFPSFLNSYAQALHFYILFFVFIYQLSKIN